MRESVSKEIRRVLEIRARQFNIALGDLIRIFKLLAKLALDFSGAINLNSGHVLLKSSSPNWSRSLFQIPSKFIFGFDYRFDHITSFYFSESKY